MKLLVEERSPERFNPVGNERLTAGGGIVLLVLTVIELGTILFGVHRFMSVHVFVGFVSDPAGAVEAREHGLALRPVLQR